MWKGNLESASGAVKLLLKHSTHVVRAGWQDAFQSTGSLIAIDATAGRGSDTLSLCQMLGSDGQVHAVDIQSLATQETKRRYAELKALNQPVADLTTYTASHVDLAALTGAPENSVAVVTYNLGWLPMREANKRIITREESTIASLDSASKLVCDKGGTISIMAYVGHNGGTAEKDAVVAWTRRLCIHQWSVLHLSYPNRNGAPHLLLCVRF